MNVETKIYLEDRPSKVDLRRYLGENAEHFHVLIAPTAPGSASVEIQAANVTDLERLRMLAAVTLEAVDAVIQAGEA